VLQMGFADLTQRIRYALVLRATSGQVLIAVRGARLQSGTDNGVCASGGNR
jgi:hypothetical protein